ncbi:MAG: terminase small subunit [Deltaproteobacteria bacterium]|nr:terminase small subunit [Deltaproteobacteria bacterium]
MKLTEKQRRFVEAYMGKAKGNATEAARIAGYKGSYSTLKQVGAENLTKPYLREAIQERVDADEDGLIADREELQQFWTKVARAKPESEDDEPPDIAMKDRLKASEYLGKTHGLFIERRHHEGSIKVQDFRSHLQRLRAIIARHVTPDQMAAIDAEIGRGPQEAQSQ